MGRHIQRIRALLPNSYPYGFSQQREISFSSLGWHPSLRKAVARYTRHSRDRHTELTSLPHVDFVASRNDAQLCMSGFHSPAHAPKVVMSNQMLTHSALARHCRTEIRCTLSSTASCSWIAIICILRGTTISDSVTCIGGSFLLQIFTQETAHDENLPAKYISSRSFVWLQ